METDRGVRLEFCSYCLCRDRGLYKYQLEKAPNLRSMFQVEDLLFCYVCTKFAKNAEEFIQQVGDAQKMFDVVDTSTLNTIRQQMLPLRCLNIRHLDFIDISPEEADVTCTELNEDESYKTYSYGGKGNENNVKVEIKLENLLQSNDDDELGDDDPTFGMKDNLSLMMKQELMTKEGDLEVLKKRVKKESGRRKGRPKKKIRKEVMKKTIKEKEVRIKKEPRQKATKEVPESSYIETLPLSPAALARERAAQASAPQYAGAPLKCAHCLIGFTLKSSYLRHMLKHSASRGEYECEICKIRKTTARLRDCHMKLHQIRYKCKICNIIRLHRSSIRTHYSICHDTATVHKCLQCNKIYKSAYSLRKHAWYVHARGAPVVCEHCRHTYANKLSLKRHIQLQHSELFPPLKTYPCGECEKAFIAPSGLKRHMLSHTNMKEFYCVECDKSFKTEQYLKCHLQTSPHVKELRHACTHCEKRFASKRNVETHVNRVHLKRRPYQSDKCDRGYVLKWSLAAHVRRRHEGYKLPRVFPCQYCDKAFELKSVLKSHIRTHTGERPYQCQHCSASFAQSSAYHTHTKLVHLKLTRDGRPKLTR